MQEEKIKNSKTIKNKRRPTVCRAADENHKMLSCNFFADKTAHFCRSDGSFTGGSDVGGAPTVSKDRVYGLLHTIGLVGQVERITEHHGNG
jgi:hypothetical protein